jgi:hypothetical protein
VATYLERLQSEFDEITTGIETLLERAAEDGRDISTEENERIERDDTRRTELEEAIKHYSGLEQRSSRVNQLRSTMPQGGRRIERSTDSGDGDERLIERAKGELERMSITPGTWAYHVHQAQVERSKSSVDWLEKAGELIERATAHQIISDNPGLIPRPIVGGLVDLLKGKRRFIESVGTQTPPAPVFDRPHVTQHTAVAVQAAEKTETASQKMTIGKIPVTLATYAGHVNLSKQDIRWSMPSLLDIIFNDFRKIYAQATDTAACADFVAGCTNTALGPVTTVAEIDAWLSAASAELLGAAEDSPDTIWLSTDMAGMLSQQRTATGVKAYDIPIFGEGGDVEGLMPVVDPRFAAGTMIVGIREYAEVWEDLEGFLQVEEPNLLGQLVGYAGYLDTVVLDPAAFVKHALVVAKGSK